jgi:NADPH:quinone reductase-like Zn-dependent oxidoreductase
MRRGDWGEVAPVSGIECVGEVVNDTTQQLAASTKVAAMLGGMGRTRNGSYAEYTTIPATNVIPLQSGLSWSELAAIPESYVTAWCCLFDIHPLKGNQVLFVRGGTSALGQAAINLAEDTGAAVLATTRSEAKKPLLESLGVRSVFIEGGELAPAIRKSYPDGIDHVLDLVGNRTVFDSLKTVRKGGRVVVAGFLGGHEPVPFNVTTCIPTGADLTFFGVRLCSATRTTRSQVFRFKRWCTKPRKASIAQSRSACSGLNKSRRRIASWNPTKPTESLSSRSNDDRMSRTKHFNATIKRESQCHTSIGRRVYR